ncbi:MAG TPA: hypothetical protein ENJ28_09995 [Gammaproteobacteria bacterium]|nr:hypothetical protein [Gammaproteobacteria bacterium]
MNNVTDNIDNAIQMLKKHTSESCIKPLIVNLEALMQDPENESLIAELTETWRTLGIYQGTVLTYVPYFFKFIPDDIFGDTPE